MANLINTQGPVQDTELKSVTLEQWQEEKDALTGQSLELTVSSEQTADLFGEDADNFARISIDFPKFADGRGYSAARLLREKYGYKGELRAVGDVLIDQVFFMKRCGFDAYVLRPDKDINKAARCLNFFSQGYQAATDTHLPLFRRRAS